MEILNEHIDTFEKWTPKKIVLIMNVKGISSIRNMPHQSELAGEFYSLDKFNTLLKALQAIGCEVLTFQDEDKFIKSVLDGDDYTDYLVMNSAQKGNHLGRKSLIPAFCDLFGIRYMGSNAYVVSLSRDKFGSNAICNYLGMHGVKSYLYSPRGWIGLSPEDGASVIVKLNNESSSIGMTQENHFRYDKSYDTKLYDMCINYNSNLIVEEFIDGYEVEATIIIGNKHSVALEPLGISINDDKKIGQTVLDWNMRCNNLYELYYFSEIMPEVSEEIKKQSVDVAHAIGLKGIGRIDYRVREDGSYYVTDIASSPHITDESDITAAFENAGFLYLDMLKIIIGSNLQ